MEKLPAALGWQWIRQGFALFRRQPAELSTLFLGYMFVMLALGIIPVFGQVLPLILSPVFSMAFMQACVQVEQDKRVYPNLLLAGFRSPALPRLLAVGLLYLLVAGLAMAASTLVDGGALWHLVSGKTPLNAATVHTPGIAAAMLVAALVYTPAAMAFWHAAPLLMWQRMHVPKALFYSFFAVYKTGKAFVIYGLGWIALGVLMPSIVSALAALLIGQAFAMMLIALPLSIAMTVVMYCSFYPTYTCIFGKPEQDSAAGMAG